MDCMKVSLQNAKDFGATAVLLVPAVVSPDIMYRDAYARSQKQIRELIPQAQELGVIIAVENVWNKFLLSPLEFARYVDEFESPFVRAYFDVGNVVLFGFPQDWIRTLGPRIAKIHLKDFKSDTKQFVPLREGSVNWPEVRKALAEIGYDGWLTTELDGGDEKYLRDVSARVDKIIAGT
jgi:hexulose-6-phosphate isomerase